MLLLVITSRVASKFKNLGGWVMRKQYVVSCYHEPCCQQVQESWRLGDEEQYVASCYHEPRCQQAQESWRLGDKEQYVASCYHEPCCQQVQESRRLGDEEQYVASCYHEPRCQQAQESWRQDIRGQWRGKLIKIKLNERKNACKIILTWSTGTDILGMVALLEKMVDTTNWEWEPVALLEKTVDTTNWEWEPNVAVHIVIALLNRGKFHTVSFSHLNTFLGDSHEISVQKKEKKRSYLSLILPAHITTIHKGMVGRRGDK